MKLSFNLNPGAQVSIPCPHCGKESDQLISELRANPELTCPACGGITQVDGSELDALIKLFEGLGR